MSEVIIVLGTGNSERMNKRVNSALSYFFSTEYTYYSEITESNNVNTYIIFSGCGNSEISEASRMVNYALSKKDLKTPLYSHIIKEDKSMNTLENLKNSKAIIKKMFNNLPNPKVTICTSSFHLKRAFVMANFIFKDYKLNFIHTDELITFEERERENSLLLNYIDLEFSQI